MEHGCAGIKGSGRELGMESDMLVEKTVFEEILESDHRVILWIIW